MVDAGIGHLREHQVRRSHHLLHADRHVLDVIVLAVDGELELAVAADAEIDARRPDHPMSFGSRSALVSAAAPSRAR